MTVGVAAMAILASRAISDLPEPFLKRSDLRKNSSEALHHKLKLNAASGGADAEKREKAPAVVKLRPLGVR